MTLNKNAESIYISAGCNRCAKALDWGGKYNQLIYAQSRSVALLSQQEPFQIKSTFNQHTDKINCVKWISRYFFSSLECKGDAPNEFLSASKDKTIAVWQGNDENVNYMLIK